MTGAEGAPLDVFAEALSRWFEELADRGIFATDAELVIRTWNPWLEAQTGIPAAAAVGAHLCTLYPTLAERGLEQYYREALNGEVRVLSERFHKYLLPIGRNFHSIGLTEMAQTARIAPLRAGDAVVGTITVIEDVTERVVSERELRNQIAVSEHARSVAEEASKLKDEFLATLSHEIRTPLNAVLGWARILRTQPGIRSRARALEVIERNAASQLRLVEDLLDMARVISGKLRLDVKPVSLEVVAQAALDVIEPGAEAKKISVRTNFAADLPFVSGDIDRLQQVIWNLLSNAVKFTESGGTIDVGLTRAGDWLEFVVRDSGQGISRDFLPYVFDRFRQADATPSRRHGGLGLGLALVRQIVELHGGSVGVESAGANRGAVFSIRLPAMIQGEEESSRALPPSAAVTLDGVKVLVVDDNDDSRDMLCVMLQQYGANVLTLPSADEAWTALDSGRFVPDVLVSDVGMPGADGYSLIRRIRAAALPATRRLPAIAVTGYANPEDRLRALAAGFQAHIAKPIDPAFVAAWISSLTSSPPPTS
jgi:signal transduction histidine kinase/ActR/RegA family two-component response regulator